MLGGPQAVETRTPSWPSWVPLSHPPVRLGAARGPVGPSSLGRVFPSHWGLSAYRTPSPSLSHRRLPGWQKLAGERLAGLSGPRTVPAIACVHSVSHPHAAERTLKGTSDASHSPRQCCWLPAWGKAGYHGALPVSDSMDGSGEPLARPPHLSAYLGPGAGVSLPLTLERPRVPALQAWGRAPSAPSLPLGEGGSRRAGTLLHLRGNRGQTHLVTYVPPGAGRFLCAGTSQSSA